MKNTEWLKEEVEKDIHHVFAEGDIYYVSREHILGLIDQLDMPEVLSKKWIGENTYHNHYVGSKGFVYADDLQNLLVPKQEVPEIPKFVANWIEAVKKQNKSVVFAITHIYDKNEIDTPPNKEEERIFQWMELAVNEEVFARAWLDGYTVEEKKYYIKIGPTRYARKYLEDRIDNQLAMFEKDAGVFTEKEILKLENGDKLWAFAEEVTE